MDIVILVLCIVLQLYLVYLLRKRIERLELQIKQLKTQNTYSNQE